jgi:hypothetical protein
MHARTWSGGMRQSDRNPSCVSTGLGGTGAHSAARCTASTCGVGVMRKGGAQSETKTAEAFEPAAKPNHR